MISDFQLRLIDIITTPDEEYERGTEELNEEEFSLLDLLENEFDC